MVCAGKFAGQQGVHAEHMEKECILRELVASNDQFLTVIWFQFVADVRPKLLTALPPFSGGLHSASCGKADLCLQAGSCTAQPSGVLYLHSTVTGLLFIYE